MVLEADYPTYPAISEAPAIGMKAEAIFRTLLPPPRWIVNKVENDFGIDFRVEVASQGKLRGCDFFAQVKGFAGQGDDHPFWERWVEEVRDESRSSRAVPQLPLFRRIFLEIVDFLACRV